LLYSFWLRVGRGISLRIELVGVGFAEFGGLEELLMNGISHVVGKDSAKII